MDSRSMWQLSSWLMVAGLIVVPGCRQETISEYTIPKEVAVGSGSTSGAVDPHAGPAEPSRMLAAIAFQKGKAWFFKAMGAEAAMAEQVEPFRKFLASVRFAADTGQPQWELPEGWQAKGAGAMRFATLAMGSEEGVPELAVSELPADESESRTEYVMRNVNRWRGQLQLPPITEAELPQQMTEVKLADGTAMMVDLAGQAAGGGMSSSPAMAGIGAAAAPAVGYTTPEGWKADDATTFVTASFRVTEGDRQLRIVLLKLPAQFADAFPTINRWRQEVGLEPLASATELPGIVQPLELGQRPAQYVALFGPEQNEPRSGVLGVISSEPEGDGCWVVTAKGDGRLAQRERERFEQFVRSIEFK